MIFKDKFISLSPLLLVTAVCYCQQQDVSRSINYNGGGNQNWPPPGILRRQGGLPANPALNVGGIGKLNGGSNQFKSDNIRASSTNLEKGPLTLVNGQLRPLNENRMPPPPPSNIRDKPYFPSQAVFPQAAPVQPRPPLQPQQPRPPPGVGSGRRQGPWEPEIHLTKLPPSASQDFNTNIKDFNDFSNGNNRRTNLRPSSVQLNPINSEDYSQLPPGPYYPPSSTDPIRPESGDWSTKVSNAASGDRNIVLDTKYFSITYPDVNIGTTEDPGLQFVKGQPGLVLRKVKGKMKTSPRTPIASTPANYNDVSMKDSINEDSSTPRLKVVQEHHNSDCLHGSAGGDKPDGCDYDAEGEEGEAKDDATTQSAIFPSYEEIIKHFRNEGKRMRIILILTLRFNI